jgi:site-specific DNA recombinase
MECMTYGVTFLSKLPHYYSKTTLEGKQMMLGSIFPEKLIFSENTYRTAEPNEIVDFLATIDGALKSNKDLTISYKSDISCRVPYGFGLSNLIDDFQSLRNLMNSRNWKSVF